MEENKPNETRKKESKGNKRPAKRTASSNGRESSQTADEPQQIRSSPWNKTVPDPKDNCTNQGSARGDEQMDVDTQNISGVRAEIVRKRKNSSQAQLIVEKRARSESAVVAPSFSESSEEKCASFVDHAELHLLTVFNSGKVEETKRCQQTFHVLSASIDGGEPTTSGGAHQVTKAVVHDTFSEPIAKEQAPLENSYFGQGAKLKDGTLRPPPEICTYGQRLPKIAAPKTEKSKEVVKEWTPGNKEPNAEPEKEAVTEPDPKKKNKVPNNTDRYLNMF